MVVDPSQYFAWHDSLLYDVVGDYWLFIFIGLILLLLWCLRCQIPIQVTILLVIFYLLCMIAMIYNGLIYAFVILVVGFFLYFMIARAMRRG